MSGALCRMECAHKHKQWQPLLWWLLHFLEILAALENPAKKFMFTSAQE